MILEKLGIYGWSESQENLFLSAFLTGDPLLLIGKHGSAKTYLANVVSEALGKNFHAYDAGKALFDDLMGYPNVEALKKGKIEYVPSELTIWDKEIILVDEINRAKPELQSKWLEIIRSRKIMGKKTDVSIVLAAMNPMTYSATEMLDEALIGRFATFLYPPNALEMSEADRIKVTKNITNEDAPTLEKWLDKKRDFESISYEQVGEVGQDLEEIFRTAAETFLNLKEEVNTLSEFLSKFSNLLMKETNKEIELDGRRLGFLYRNILATRAIELSKSRILGTDLSKFEESAKDSVMAGIPVELREDTEINREQVQNKVENCFSLLEEYFKDGTNIHKVDLIYELFTTQDPMRKAEILINYDVGDFASSKAWNDIVNSEQDITMLAITALTIEAENPGIIPQELISDLASSVEKSDFNTSGFPNLKGDNIEYLDKIEDILEAGTTLRRIVAYSVVRHALANQVGGRSKQTGKRVLDFEDIEAKIEERMKKFKELIHGQTQEKIGIGA